ncbi:hypothetical protein E4U23_001597 [Claviceps purpurea]|nr:hypothetical protein E4U23_001597 [Claviceps purpurea]
MTIKEIINGFRDHMIQSSREGTGLPPSQRPRMVHMSPMVLQIRLSKGEGRLSRSGWCTIGEKKQAEASIQETCERIFDEKGDRKTGSRE